MKRLLTVDQVAQVLDCSPSTVRRRIRAGKLRAWRDGGLVRVSEEALDAYMEAGEPETILEPSRPRRRPLRARSRGAALLYSSIPMAEWPDLIPRLDSSPPTLEDGASGTPQ